MGRANQKPRKGKKTGHLPKVGSAAELAHEGAAERSAVMDVMGMGNLSPASRRIVGILGTALLIAAVVALVVLTVV